ncbi:MAG: FtsX-like permease family protein [Candidatus Eisenbacteria bacterium]|nr:FtsX-like permease family protein [Candidatus Latescibacterota bacterium]MBD3302861.1 FtsX-like permease family protein [Candidatus Eisenbacteria bacterium]
MIFVEFLRIAFENLRRMKLRTALTSAGVMVGIGALVAMLSFGFGIQRNVSAQFEEIGLFRTIQVLPGKATGDSAATPLDELALQRIGALDGVALVYPQETFDGNVTWRDSTRQAVVQALPASFVEQRSVGEMVAGRFFASDSAREAVVSRAWLRELDVEPDSILGDTLTIRAATAGGLIKALGGRVLENRGMDSEAAEGLASLGEWLLGGSGSGALRLVVVGVAEVEWGFGFRLGEILVPTKTVEGIDALSFGDPLELMAMLDEGGGASSGWSVLIVTLESERDYTRVEERIEELGYSTFSFLDRFDEMRKGFLVFDFFIGAIGLIALLVAALGIVNTMVMSIIERTREIGILKSLGAEEGHLRLLFLVESGAIGLIGSLAGLLLGWGVSRGISTIIQYYMKREGAPVIDLFDLPVWTAFAAIGFGILVSVLAGLYPSSRAARVDPVQALRHD